MRIRSAVDDRRTSPRHFLNIPLRVRLWKSPLPEQKSFSRNLSTCGAYFTTELPVQVGSVLELFLPMPEEITGEPLSEWRFSGHVVRVVPEQTPQQNAVAMQFDCYEIERAQSPETSEGRPIPIAENGTLPSVKDDKS